MPETAAPTIAAAQSTSRRGAIEANVAEHLRFVAAAATRGVDLVVFPELSLTGYELDSAGSLQLTPDDPRLAPLRDAARAHEIHVLVGAPWTSTAAKPFIGAFLYAPAQVTAYAKIHVTRDEAEWFAAGDRPCIVPIRATLTANYGGSTGGLESAGKSAVWDERGALVARAPARGDALVIARYAAGRWRGEVVTDF